MKKQGFTLIELMVVIVIMGILAAVAVPKLFGMIAKSKASEVGPAAGTYVKLQTAHVSEASMIGSWIAIGYSGPGDNTRASGGAGGTTSKTGNFEYADASSGFTDETVALSSSDVTGWSAKNIYTLNNCTEKTGDWTIKVKKGSVAGEAAFTASVNAAGCPELTPTFKNIGN